MDQREEWEKRRKGEGGFNFVVNKIKDRNGR
jgi:hypothetical protein